MGYSRIVSVELFNFMVYKHAKITFDDTNIINLKGYNSSGKSTVLRALAVCFMDSYKKRQTKLIRYGEDYFRIVVEFDDGVRIVRDKYINGQSLYEMYQGDELLFTTREGNSLTRVDDVPSVIGDYLGLVVLNGGCLNYQTRSNKLWLVETVGSENYYSLNEVLKTESIARANTLLNSDKNKLSSEITGIESELQSTELALQGCSGVSEELLSLLMEREGAVQKLLRRQRAIEGIVGVCEKLSNLREIPVLEGIRVDRLGAVDRVSDVLGELCSCVDIPTVEGISYSRLSGITRVGDCLSGLEAESTGAVAVGEIGLVDVDSNDAIDKIVHLISDINSLMVENSRIKKEFSDTKEKLQEVISNAKSRGFKFVRCENCGSYMEVSTGA